MSDHQILELSCSCCSQTFAVMLDRRSDVLCPRCANEQRTLEDLYQLRGWEVGAERMARSRRIKYGMLALGCFMVAVLAVVLMVRR